jgi:hypothetical protein
VQQFEEMEELTYDVAVALTLARDIKVESPVYGTQSPVYGTELRLSVGDCENVATASTGRVRPGTWGNAPSGEAFVLPTSAEGSIFINKAISDVHPTGFDPFVLQVEGNRISLGGDPKSPLRERIDQFKETAREQKLPLDNVRRVCEFGIGTNPKAQAFNFIEIEKVEGTVHVAVGDNSVLGGKIKAPNHTDMVSARSTVKLTTPYDTYSIMTDGDLDPERIQDVYKVDYSSITVDNFHPRQYVECYRQRVREEQDTLVRQWKDGRDNPLAAQIGSEETAQEALKIWKTFGDNERIQLQHLIAAYENDYASGTKQKIKVMQVLRIMECFGAVALVGETYKWLCKEEISRLRRGSGGAYDELFSM